MKHLIITKEDITILSIEGRLDAHTVGAVEQEILAVTASPPARLVINLGGVTFVDTRAITVMIQGMKRCRTHGGDVHFCNFSQPVQIIFELMRLDKALTIFDDQATATTAFIPLTPPKRRAVRLPYMGGVQ